MKKGFLNVKFDVFSILLILGIFAALYFSVRCDIAQNEKNTELTTLQQDYSKEVNDGIRLQIEIDQRSDFFSVEKYASEVLGMHKVEKYQIQYIRHDVSGSAELLNREEDDDLFGRVSKVFSAIGDFFAE